MKMASIRHTAVAALAALLVGGAGIAFAASPSSSPAQTPTAPAVEPAEPTGPDTDNVQEGDQTTPDAPAGAGVSTTVVQASTNKAVKAAPKAVTAADTAAPETGTETPAAETEQAGAEEPGDANLPGGGHADDPNDPNADHQFEGQE